MVDRSDSILWQRMATEEMRREARRRGIKLSDLEEERALSVAIQESATIGNPSTTIPLLTSHPTVAAVNGNSTSASPSILPLHGNNLSLNETEQTQLEQSNGEDDDALPDCDQLLRTIPSLSSPPPLPPPTATGSATATTMVAADVTTTVALSIWQTSLPHEITNKVLYYITSYSTNTHLDSRGTPNPLFDKYVSAIRFPTRNTLLIHVIYPKINTLLLIRRHYITPPYSTA